MENMSRSLLYNPKVDLAMEHNYGKFHQIVVELSHGNKSVEEQEDETETKTVCLPRYTGRHNYKQMRQGRINIEILHFVFHLMLGDFIVKMLAAYVACTSHMK